MATCIDCVHNDCGDKGEHFDEAVEKQGLFPYARNEGLMELDDIANYCKYFHPINRN